MMSDEARARKAIVARLERLREALGYTRQKDMASLAGMREGNWSEVLACKRDLPRTAAQLLKDATGVTLDWIYDDDIRGLPFELAKKLRGR